MNERHTARRRARRARIDLERALRSLAALRSGGDPDAGRAQVRLPLFERRLEVRTLARLVEGFLRAVSGPDRRLALALLSGRRLLEVIDVRWFDGEDAPIVHRTEPLDVDVPGSRRDDSFQEALAGLAREATGVPGVAVLTFDVRLLGALAGPESDGLDRLAKVLLLAAKGLRAGMLRIDPPGRLAPWIPWLSALRIRPSLLAWFLRRTLPGGRFVLFLEEGDAPPLALVLDADGPRIEFRLEPDPLPPGLGPDAGLAERVRAVRQALEASLAFGISLCGRERFLSTRSEVLDLPRLADALAGALPWGRELAATGWTLEGLSRILRGRIRSGLERLRTQRVALELTDGEEYWTAVWNGRALSDAPRPGGRGAAEDGPPGPPTLEIPVDLPTFRWVLGLFLESGPTRLIAIASSRLPEGTRQSIDLDEVLLALDVLGPGGEPERLLVAGGAWRHLDRRWPGEAHLFHLAGDTGRVLEHLSLPRTPISIERRPDSISIRLPAGWRDPEAATEEAWICEPVAEAPFECGLSAFVSPSSEIDRLAPGIRSRIWIGRVRPPRGHLVLGGEVRRISAAVALVRSGHGLAYASLLATRRASLSAVLGPASDPCAIHLQTAWPAVGEAAPAWLEAVTRRTEHRGLVLGPTGEIRTLEAHEFAFPLAPSGTLLGPLLVSTPSGPMPLALSIVHATSVPIDPSGVHAMRAQVLITIESRTGWGVLEIPYAARALRLEGPIDDVLEVEAVPDPTGGVRLRVGGRDALTLADPSFSLHLTGRSRSRLDAATDWWRRTLGIRPLAEE